MGLVGSRRAVAWLAGAAVACSSVGGAFALKAAASVSKPVRLSPSQGVAFYVDRTPAGVQVAEALLFLLGTNGTLICGMNFGRERNRSTRKAFPGVALS